MAIEKTTVTVPKPLQKRLAHLARTEGTTQVALIEQMVKAREDAQFWSELRSATGPYAYRVDVDTDGDAPSGDYTAENAPLATEEAETTW